MASLYDSASLVMIPSGVKDGKAYSIKPTDGSGDFTFSRGTDTATRVNASGLIEKERGNIVKYSQEYGGAGTANWANVGSATITTDNTTAPDGTLTADKLAKASSGTSGVYQIVSVSSGNVYTYSVYVKNDSNCDDLLLGCDLAPTTANLRFNPQTGVASSVGAGVIDHTITDAGSGWYRVSITYVATGGSNTFLIYSLTSAADSFFAWGAQVQQGLVATDYIETTTAAVYEGITDNLPRLDYSGGASCPSLLLESSRTNKVASSEYFSSGWTFVGVTKTDNYGISPEGVQNSTRIVFSGADNYMNFPSGVGVGFESCSVYVKGTAGETIRFGKGSNVAQSVNHTLTGDWQRLEFVGEDRGSALHISTYGGVTARDIEIYGLQLEDGSYPTSYIPTYGTAASRAGDSCALLNMITNGIGTSGAYSVLVEVDVDENASGDNSVVLSLAQDESLASVEISLNAYEQQESGRMRLTSATDGTITYLNSPNTRKYAFSVDGTNVVATDESSVKNDTLSVSGNSKGLL